MSSRVLAVVLSFLAGLTFSTAPALAQVPEGLSGSEWTSIRAAYEDGRHRVFEVDGGFEARSHRQQYLARFDGRGVSIAPDEGDWTFDLKLVGYGRGDDVVTVSSPIATTREARRIEYRWDERVTEWYVNGDDGLEHGFTVASPPSGSADLEFVLAVQSELRGSVDPDKRCATFVDLQGRDVVHYRGLLVVDATGAALDAHMTCTGCKLTLHVDDASAIYPIVIDPIVQQAYVKASNSDGGASFGASVAIDGDTVVVGAVGESSSATGVNGNQTDTLTVASGAVYVFVRAGSTWEQQAYIKASNTGTGDVFGTSVDIDGNTVVVGAPGEGSSATGVNGNHANNSASNSGAAYVFTRNGSTWVQQAYLKASNTENSDFFGASVAIAGDTVVVGAIHEGSSATLVNGDQSSNSAPQAGAVYVFTRSASTWSQQAYLKASNAEIGDRFGGSIGIHGETVVVGAGYEDGSATGVNGDQTDNSAADSGAAYVFTRSGAAWALQSYLKASNTDLGDRFGWSVAIYDETIVVGALLEDSSATGVNGDELNLASPDAGAVYVFVRTSSAWSQQAYLKASNTDAADMFGTSVAIDGDIIVVGAYSEDGGTTGVNGNQSDNSAAFSGAAYAFMRSGMSWVQIAYLKSSNTDLGDLFGGSVAIDGSVVVVGATGEAGNSAGVNGNQADNSSVNSGAVYIFDLNPEPDWRIIAGCHGNTAAFVLPTTPAQIGTTVPIDLAGSVVSNGIVATYYGITSVDGFGCGLQLSPTEELLLALAPFPTLYAYSVMSAGLSTMPLTLPNNAGIVGFVVTLQAAAIDTTTFASELSDGLEFVIRP